MREHRQLPEQLGTGPAGDGPRGSRKHRRIAWTTPHFPWHRGTGGGPNERQKRAEQAARASPGREGGRWATHRAPVFVQKQTGRQRSRRSRWMRPGWTGPSQHPVRVCDDSTRWSRRACTHAYARAHSSSSSSSSSTRMHMRARTHTCAHTSRRPHASSSSAPRPRPGRELRRRGSKSL